jgi:hypothetical protein
MKTIKILESRIICGVKMRRVLNQRRNQGLFRIIDI